MALSHLIVCMFGYGKRKTSWNYLIGIYSLSRSIPIIFLLLSPFVHNLLFFCSCAPSNSPLSLSPFSFPTEITLQVSEEPTEVTEVIQKVTEEVKVVEEEKPKKLKITKKKKSKVEPEPEKKPEPFTVSLKKVKKKPLLEAKEGEEKTPFEEVAEFTTDFPTEVIEFIDIEDGMEPTEVTTEGVKYFSVSMILKKAWMVKKDIWY